MCVCTRSCAYVCVCVCVCVGVGGGGGGSVCVCVCVSISNTRLTERLCTASVNIVGDGRGAATAGMIISISYHL